LHYEKERMYEIHKTQKTPKKHPKNAQKTPKIQKIVKKVQKMAKKISIKCGYLYYSDNGPMDLDRWSK
jgi:uncharacterized FlaG/YvyC family protein